MDKTRLWMIGALIAMVAIVGLGWGLGVQPQLDQAAAADVQTAEVDATNEANQAVIDQLKKDSANLPALKKELASLTASVPPQSDNPALVDELNGYAVANGVLLAGWVISDGKAYVAPVAPTQAAASTESGAGSTPSPSPAPTASATPAPNPAKAAETPGMPPFVSPLITGKNFAVVPVSFSVSGAYPNVLAFLHDAQTGPRLFLVNNVVTAPSSNGLGVDATVRGFTYVLTLPNAAAAQK